MNLKKIYQNLFSLNLVIIIFGIQDYLLNKYNYYWNLYEYLVLFIFLLSFIIVLSSSVFLIYGSIRTVNRKSWIREEVIYLIGNLVCYILVIITCLYLSTQLRQ